MVQYFAGILKVLVDPEAWEKGRKRAKQLLDTNEPPACCFQLHQLHQKSILTLIAGLFLLPVSITCGFCVGWCSARSRAPGAQDASQTSKSSRWLVASPVALVWMVPLILPFQLQMHGGSMAGWGPDTSIGLLPFPHLLAYEFIFFMAGALIYTTPKASERFGNLWWLTGGLAIAAYLMEPTTHMQSAVQQTVLFGRASLPRWECAEAC